MLEIFSSRMLSKKNLSNTINLRRVHFVFQFYDPKSVGSRRRDDFDFDFTFFILNVVSRTARNHVEKKDWEERKKKRNDSTGHVLSVGNGWIYLIFYLCVCMCVWAKTLLPVGSNRRSSVSSGGADDNDDDDDDAALRRESIILLWMDVCKNITRVRVCV